VSLVSGSKEINIAAESSNQNSQRDKFVHHLKPQDSNLTQDEVQTPWASNKIATGTNVDVLK